MSTWKPIATAPKDGTEIYIGRSDDNGISVVVRAKWIGDRFVEAAGGDLSEATHWKPVKQL